MERNLRRILKKPKALAAATATVLASCTRRADCYNGRQTSGKQRWTGDRRGSFAYCAGNSGIDPRYFHGIVKNW